jgi:hypothetical protein
MIYMADGQQPAGWYPDPAGDVTKLRYWDGSGWTEQLMDAATSQAAAPSVPVPSYSPDPNQPYGQQPYQPQYAPATTFPGGKDNKNLAIAGLICGIVGLGGAWLIALIGYILGALAIVFGIKGRKSSAPKIGTASLVIGIVVILFSCINSILGIMLAASMFNF